MYYRRIYLRINSIVFYNQNNNPIVTSKKNTSFKNRISTPKNLPDEIIKDILDKKISTHFVPTPPNIVQLMIKELGGIKPNDKVLEPSAGCGHICDGIVSTNNRLRKNIDVVEPVESFRTILSNKGYNLVANDILSYNPDFKYDKIIMNPPFKKYILHIMHCFKLLKPNGRLVSIVPEKCFTPLKQNGYQEWVRDWLNDGNPKELYAYVQELLATNPSKVIKLNNAFINSDVPDDIQTRMIVITKKSN